MTDLIISIISKYSYFGVLILIVLENIFPPIPSELILTFSGFIALKAKLNLLLLIIFSTIGSLIGALLLYYFGNLLNSNLKKKFHFNENKLSKTNEYLEKYGLLSIFLARLIPMIRSLISIPAGIKKIKLLPFIILTTLGSLIWNSILILSGNILGENWDNALFYLDKYSYIVLILFFIFLLYKTIKCFTKKN